MTQAMQTKRSASSKGAARASASAPQLGARFPPTPSGPVGPWASSSVPCMTGTGPDPWWRAPMVDAMVGMGMLSPFAEVIEVGDQGVERSDASLSRRASRELTSRRQKMASQRHLPSGPRFPPPSRRKMTPSSSMRERDFSQRPLMPPGYSRMPGMMPGRRPGMASGMMPSAYPGMAPGMPMMPGAPMIPMMPGTIPMHPQQVTAQAVAPGVVTLQGIGSQPRVLTVPMGGGGSRTSVIPMPIPMPMPLPMPSPGGGGGQGPVILAGTSPPAAQQVLSYPAPYCHQHAPPPQQQPPVSPLAEAAAVTMMMQQMRLLLHPPSPRVRRTRPPPSPPPPPPPPPAPAPAPPVLPPVVVENAPPDVIAALQAILAQQQAQGADALGLKKPAKATGKTKKGDKSKGGGKKSDKAGKEEEGDTEDDKEEKEEEKREKEQKKGKKEAVKKGTGKQEGPEAKAVDRSGGSRSQATQEGTTQGKGPDSNAPALSLSFPRDGRSQSSASGGIKPCCLE
ncbi:uncharacterized protein [Dermacentor albipictus]|uniref:uncharacterized protein isoform X2 n=1 Tax=Dermacentor albipictus TaxID=60249 RepID=UPI0031FBB196